MKLNYDYKHTKGFIAFFALICVLLLIAPVFSQTATVDITGNLVNNTQTATSAVSTWQNGKFVSELKCWQPGDPDCSPGTPYIRPDGSINFSYGYTELYQVVNVSKALPNSGTGLVTTGFTFSWRSKNGNYWDDARQDELKAYVQGYTKSGQWIENFNYSLNFIHDWTDYSWSENWSKLRRPNDLSNVIFGFAGKDNNYWVGPYGPEITNVNFQLKYKPDPCVTNPLFSPECPKFQETLQKNLASTTTTTDTLKPPPEFNPQQSQDGAPPPPKSDDKLFMAEKEDGVYEEPLVDINRLIDTLIKIEDNQIREQQITMDAVTTAISETEKITNQTVRQAEQIASRAIRQSIEIGMISQQQSIQENASKENKSQQSISLFQAPTSIATDGFKLPGVQNQMNGLLSPTVQNQVETNSTSTQHTTNRSQEFNTGLNLLSANQASVSTPSGMTTQTLLQTTNNNDFSSSFGIQTGVVNPLASLITDTPTLQTNFLTNKADPINAIIESKSNIEEKKDEPNTSSVNRNAQNNEVAGGVDIASIAIQPPGFNQYASLVLRDAVFYTPKEIYRGQRTVDNARALRQLASDRLHQEMVDQQYLQR